MFVLPAGANTAEYFVSDNGTSLSASITMTDQSEFYLVKPGIFGNDEVLKVENFSLKNSSGVEVISKQSDYTVKFEKGNYTLTYNAKISDNLVYAKYPSAYNVTVHIPDKYTTGHLVLGTASKGGVINKTDSGTDVEFMNTKAVSVTFYENNRPMILYGFIGIWLVVLIFVLVRHRIIKKRVKKINE